MDKKNRIIVCILCCFFNVPLAKSLQQNDWLAMYNPCWTSQSKNASESMPCGGGDVGMNVWVENNEVLFYLSRSGVFDENNVFPKLGRVRLNFSPNPFEGAEFRQELKLRKGYVEIEAVKEGRKTTIQIWADVFKPVVEVNVISDQALTMIAFYENWRTEPLIWNEEGRVRASIAYRGAPVKAVIQPDSIILEEKGVLWYHRNREKTVFDLTVEQQQLEAIKKQLWNPLKYLTFGGYMKGDGMISDKTCTGRYIDTSFKGFRLKSKSPARIYRLNVMFHTAQTETLDEWLKGLNKIITEYDEQARKEKERTRQWWNNFWNRSHVVIDSDSASLASPSWQVGRNYQLFRYQLACNAYGKTPTKFNGGLFTYDPSLVNKNCPFTPDHRDWGGGTHTAQNQRLVYWPMLKNGDTDMLKSQLDFYLNSLVNAEQRVKHYWGHEGACFTEQIEWFGLPMAGSYGWSRSPFLHPGIQHNLWVDYEWDTVFEFCQMALDMHRFTEKEIKEYLPLVIKCLTFYDEHYQMLAKQRSANALDENGKLVLYPSTGCETYKMAYNSANTIGALKSVTHSLLRLPTRYLSEEQRKYWEEFEQRIPDLPVRYCNGQRTLAPALAWERINNFEIPQLYSVFPWGLYGIGRPDLEIAINTWKYGVDRENQRGYISWHQDGIFCARLGLTEEAKEITLKKMTDSPRRYPTFWGPGHDWVPDHNWGGSGMIGIQEMLMQTVEEKIYLFPAWPREWNVNFKLHAPDNTIVECSVKNGKIQKLLVIPEVRKKDVVVMLD